MGVTYLVNLLLFDWSCMNVFAESLSIVVRVKSSTQFPSSSFLCISLNISMASLSHPSVLANPESKVLYVITSCNNLFLLSNFLCCRDCGKQVYLGNEVLPPSA